MSHVALRTSFLRQQQAEDPVDEVVAAGDESIDGVRIDAGAEALEEIAVAEVADEDDVRVVDEEGGVDGADEAAVDGALDALHGGDVDGIDEETEVGVAAIGVQQLALEEAGEGGMAGVEGLDLVDEEGNALADDGAGEELALDLGDAAEGLGEDGFVQGVLGVEVVEDGGLVGAGGVGYLLDGDAGKPALGEERGGGVEDGLATVAGAPSLTRWSGYCYHMVSIRPAGGMCQWCGRLTPSAKGGAA